MQDHRNRIGLADWTLESGCEPKVRVGVVLPEDGDTQVRLDIPSAGYGASASPAGGRACRSIEGRIIARCAEQGVVLEPDDDALGAASRWRIMPPALADDADAPCVTLHRVVAGRGFHWEKRIEQRLPGILEIAQVDGKMLLVNELPIEAYLKGVITAEMSGECPLDLLKAQCVTARSWMLAGTEHKHEGYGFDYCNDDCCQRYQGFTHLTASGRQAVDQTRGETMLHRNGTIIDANYSKSCGGVVEAPGSVWGRHKAGQYAVADAPPDSYARGFLPVTPARLDEYLTGDWLKSCDVFCSPTVVPTDDLARYLGAVDEAGEYFRWTVETSREQLERVLHSRFFERTSIGGRDGLAMLEDLVVTRRGQSGRAIALTVVYRGRDGQQHIATVVDQYWIRYALSEKFLFSSAFKVEIERDDAGRADTIRFVGAGWGHGAGLCQIGALGMALQEYDYFAILHHYFERMRVSRAYA